MLTNKVFFIITFVATFLLTRILVHRWSNPNRTEKTFSWYIRDKLKIGLHHVHFGIFLVLIAGIIWIYTGVNSIFLIIFAIGLSWIADQLLSIMDLVDYFSMWGVFWSIILHLLFGSIVVTYLL